MQVPLYKEAFSHSWRLATRHYGLWPFGLFAAALGQMGIVDMLAQLWFTARSYQPGKGWAVLFSLFKDAWIAGQFPTDEKIWLFFILIVCLGLGFLFVFVSIASQGALIDATAYSVKHRTHRDAELSWHKGVAHAWPVLVVHLLRKGILGMTGLVIGTMALSVLLSTGVSRGVFLLTFVFASAIGLCVSFLAIYTVCYIVLEEYRIWQAIRAAWILFLEHWLVSFEVGITIAVLNIGVVGILLFGLFLSLVPAFFAYLFALLFSSATIFWIGVALSSTLFLVCLFFVASVCSVFVTSTWTFLFMRMHKTGLKSHILHWLR